MNDIILNKEEFKELILKLSSPKWPVRRSAAEEIIDMHESIEQVSDNMVDTLIETIKEDNEDVRYWITVVLGKLKNPYVINKLISLLSTSSKDVCFWIIKAISEIGQDYSNIIIKFLKESNDQVQYYLLESIKDFDNENFIPILIKILKKDNEKLKIIAIKILENYSNKNVIDALLDELDNKNWYIREKVFDALDKIDRKNSFYKEKKSMLFQSLMSKLDDKVKDKFIAEIFSSINDLEIIFEESLNNGNWYHYYLIGKLCENLGSYSISLARAMIKSEYKDIKYIGIKILGKIGDDTDITELMKLLGDNDESIVYTVLKVMREITINSELYRGKNIFRKLIKERSDIVKRFLLEFIGDIKVDEYSDILIENLSSPNENLRFISAVALGKLNDLDVVEALVRCFQDKYWPVRRAASLSIANLGHEVINILENVMEHGNENEIFWAVTSLSNIKDYEAERLQVILKGLDSNYITVRQNIIKTLAKYKGEQSCNILLNILENDNEDDTTKIFAIKSLRKHLIENTFNTLKKCSENSNNDIRFWAVKILSYSIENENVRELFDNIIKNEVDKKILDIIKNSTK